LNEEKTQRRFGLVAPWSTAPNGPAEVLLAGDRAAAPGGLAVLSPSSAL